MDNTVSRCALERLDHIKEAGLARKEKPEVKKRRQVLRGNRKKRQDHAERTEEPSYEAGKSVNDESVTDCNQILKFVSIGAFACGDQPDSDRPGPSGVGRSQPQNRRATKAKQPARKSKKRPRPSEDSDADDASSLPADAQPTRKSTRARHPTSRLCIDYQYDDDDDD